MKWRRPQTPTSSLALTQANLIGWVTTAYGSENDNGGQPSGGQPSGSRKEAMLRQSLELVRDERDNGSTLFDIVQKAVDAGCFRLAVDAVRAINVADDPLRFGLAVTTLFEMKSWPHLPEGFAAECARRVLTMPEARSAVGWDNHFTDYRSASLGWLGVYAYLNGSKEAAFHLWEQAIDAYDVDEVIARVGGEMVSRDRSRYDDAMALLPLISTKTIKAKLLAALSDYA